MKKCVLFVVLVSAVVFSVFSQNGTIRELTGDVELKQAGSDTFTAARTGAVVAQDTIVSTGFKSTAIIEVGSNLITVRPLTRLSLSEIQLASGSENVNINLQAGRIRVDVKPPAGTRATTTVQSPSATASVRGTELEMDTNNIEVISGRVGLSGSDGIVIMVPAGTSNSISSDGVPSNRVDVIQSGNMPPAPVGAGSSGGSASSSPLPGDSIDIDLDWGS